MATDNNIKNFAAADIEKYHKGLLSAKEMHDLEKAALDDPFLADALEGYAVAGVNAETDIAELKKRLGQRTEVSKVIPLNNARKNNYRMLKIAAMLLFVAGAAFSVYQFGFNKKTDSIAKNEPIVKEVASKLDSFGNDSIGAAPKTTDTKLHDKTSIEPVENQPIPKKPGADAGGALIENDIVTSKGNDGNASETKAFPPPLPAPVGNTEAKKLLAKDDTKNKAAVITKQETAAEVSKERGFDITRADDEKANRSVAANRKAEEQNYRNQTSNIFRGRVTDQNNVGVPFANVTNLEENTGTYTDVRGYFNLTYPDSILNVQVRSIGFENNNVQLRNAAPTNQVILNDDRSSLSEVVISNQKPNLLARSNNNTMQLEEPEPTDGWGYYDNYLVNNIQLPDEYKSKPLHSGEVQVSFEVDKNGEPTNFKIVKSLCKKCDKEAIRLIKEGPKWIRKAKNGRTTVTIPF